MLAGTALLGAALLLNPPESMGSKTDVLYMKNGDKLTCEIKTMDAGALYVSLDYVDGTISVSWARIARVVSTRLFLVQTDDGSVYTGRLSIDPIEGTDSVRVIITQQDGSRIPLDKSQVAGLSSTADSFWGRLNGSVSSGVSYTKGNSNTTYNFSSNVAYPRPRWSASLSYNSNLSATSGASTSTRNQMTLSFGHLMRWNNWFYSGFASGLQSAEQQISLQTNLSGGFGRYLKRTSNVRASVVGGLVWQSTAYESSVTTASNEETIGVMVMGNLNFVQFKRQSLSLRINAIPSINDFGRFYFSTNAVYFLKLFGEVNWNLSFYGNWDTQPPAGASGSDYGLNSGLSWTFGNR